MRYFSKPKNTSLLVALVVCSMLWCLGGGSSQLLAGSEETYKGLKLFSEVLELVEKEYVDQVDADKLIEGAIQGMVHSLDPHSSLLPPEAFNELQQDTRGEFGGIGVVISMRDGMVTVVAPIEGTPASRAGMMAGDRIIEVDGESTKDMKLWEAARKMRGRKGTPVVLTVFREGLQEPWEVSLVRDIIPIESVHHISLEPGFGYVRITNFRDSTTDDVEAALKEMVSADQPMKGLILDLRNNPGGLLSQAIAVADLFVEKGDLVSIKGRQKIHTRTYRARRNLVKRDYPLVVLIDGGSASASEIVAGALQDHKRGLILGTTSFGKGSVQSVEPLRDGYGIKLTIARYYTPNGKSIQAEGTVPDIVVPAGFDRPSEEEGKGMSRIKEKDLKNHLEPEKKGETNSKSTEETPNPKELVDPEATNSQDDKKEKEKAVDQAVEESFGKLSIERLQSDHQVRRALEILKGHAVLSGSRS